MATTCTFTSRDAAAFAQRIKDSESAESVEARTSRYYQYLEDSEASKIPVINTKTRAGTDISLLIKIPPSLTGNLGDVSNISGDLASEWGCSTCVRRLHTLRNFVGADGKAVFCRLAHPCRTDLQSELNGKCEKIISEFNKRYGAISVGILRLLQLRQCLSHLKSLEKVVIGKRWSVSPLFPRTHISYW